MRLKEEYPVTTICAVLDLPRSSFYHQPVAPDESGLQLAIQDLAAQYPTYGYRRITVLLQRRGWTVNHKRIGRIMAEMGLQRSPRRRRTRTTDSQHGFERYPNLVKDLTAAYPEHLWVADITYVRLHREFVYLAVIMDGFTRAVRGWHLSRSLDRTLTLTARQGALVDCVPDIHHSDQSWQYACDDYTDLLQQYHIQISMATVGKPEENGYAERLMRTIREEEIDLAEYEDFHHAYRSIGRFLEDVYTHKRIHSALGYLTSSEFEAHWLTQ
jgi:putative transposase